MEDRGPFDRILQPEPARYPDRTATFVVAAAIVLGLVLLVLVLPPVSIFSGDGGTKATGPVSAKPRDESPAPPEGFESVSALFDLVSAEPVQQSARLTVNLSVTTQEGDTLYLFTRKGDSWRQIAEATAVGNGESAVGEVSVLPDNVAVFRRASDSRVIVGSLPPDGALDAQSAGVLTALNVWGFYPNADGTISSEAAQLPTDSNVAIAPTIGSGGSFDVLANINAVLASPDLRSAHAQAIANLVRDGGYAGVDLDYRGMDPANGTGLVALVSDLSNALRAEGKSLSLELPVPLRQADTWQTYGFDWQALAPLVDYMRLANEPEQSLYHQRIEDALGYLVPLVGGSKLMLSVGPFSHEGAADGVHELSLTDALTEASVVAAEPGGSVGPGATVQASGQNLSAGTGGGALHWDDAAKAVSFTYTGPGGQRTVWLSNVFSESFKIDLAARYHLGGIAIDDVSDHGADANIWPALREYAQNGSVTLSTPNDSLLRPSWVASGGTLDSDAGDTVTWQAPAEAGTYTLTLVVSDGVMRVGQEIQVQVTAPAAAGD